MMNINRMFYIKVKTFSLKLSTQSAICKTLNTLNNMSILLIKTSVGRYLTFSGVYCHYVVCLCYVWYGLLSLIHSI